MILADQRRKSLCFLAALAWSALTVVSAGAPPPNDRFAEATLLVGAPVSAEGSTAGATHEPGEPAVPGNTAGQSVWWTWTAPGDGLLTLTAAPSFFFYSTALAVFGGEAVDSLQLLGSNESIWANRFGREIRMREQLSVTVAAGRQYHIAADWNSFVPIGAIPGPVVVVCPDCPPPILPPVGGPVTFTLGFIPAPSNDAFEQSGRLSGNHERLVADTTGSSQETGEPEGLFHTLWWRWTAPRSGLLDFGPGVPAPKPVPTSMTVRTQLPVPVYDDPLGWPAGMVIPIDRPIYTGGNGSGGGSIGVIIVGPGGGWWPDFNFPYEQNPPPPFTPAVRLFAGDSLSELELLAGGPLTQTNRLEVVGGQTYHFELGSLTEAMGPAAFELQLTAPENDNFADRVTITGTEAKATGHTVGATLEPGDPAPALGLAGHTAWWTWTAPEDCVAIWSVTSPTSFPLLAVYHGSTLTNLENVTVAGEFRLRVARGEVLQLEVVSYTTFGSYAKGDYTIVLKAEPIPPELDAAPRKLADGSRQFQVNRLRGRGILIYASADLSRLSSYSQSWPPLGPLWAGVVNADSATFLDRTPASDESRYYVVRLAQPGDEKWFVLPPPPVVVTNTPSAKLHPK